MARSAEREEEAYLAESRAAYTAYVSSYNLLVKSVETMGTRLSGLEDAPTWEGIGIVERALDALTPGLQEMQTLAMVYVNSLRDVATMVDSARQSRTEVQQI